MINRAILVGNLGKDPELSTAKTGTEVVKFSLATSRFTKGETATTWHNVKAFGKTAAAVAANLSKGSKVYIEGEINNSSYEKDGQKRYFSEVLANQVKFLDSRKPGDNDVSVTTDDVPY